MDEMQDYTLFVAATRPAMVRLLLLSLPIGVFALLLMAAGLIMVLGQNPKYELAIVPLCYAAHLAVRRDYNRLRVIRLWLATSARSFDAPLWGGACPTPFPERRARGAPPRGALP
jgi:type IV secretory pathway VirB3-like protein